MEQIAVVKAVLNNGMAEVTVERETACGAAHSCSECAGCEKMMTRTQNVDPPWAGCSACCRRYIIIVRC